MKKTKEVQETVTVIADIICNKCGESCRTNTHPEEINSEPQFDGLLEVTTQGGWYSKVLGDCTKHTFSLCETCLMDLIKTFKISSYQGDYLWGLPINVPEEHDLTDEQLDLIFDRDESE